MGVFLISLSLSLHGAIKLPETIKVASHELPPYHWLNKDNKLEGPALKPFQCILGKLGITPQITVFPLARARELVKHQQYDAFFIISQNSQRDKFATLSKPFYFDTWYFYYHPNQVFSLKDPNITDRRLGVLLGSNMKKWSGKKGFENRFISTDYQPLFNSLDKARLEIVMATDGIYREQMLIRQWPYDHFEKEKVRDLNMGVYFGHHLLSTYPDLLSAFNRQVDSCIE